MKLLDLFCGAGGAAMGYHLAGFDEIVGVDIELQPNYPFAFFPGDVLDLGANFDWGYFDLIHASPPCQHFTRYRNAVKDITERYEDLIAPTRRLLLEAGKPFVIENVPGAPMRTDLMLCGSMFDLSVFDPIKGHEMHLKRHRLFEVSFATPQPRDRCAQYRGRIGGVYGGGGSGSKKRGGGYTLMADQRREIMGMPWATQAEVSEAIPPRYTQFIGDAFLQKMASAA